ncbi:multicopper oxidase [Athelia psychrophila]|uniref:Multicopper oxidase n=1 Tax=Athelia psychrophila TaxID=1759441 RepID=A0A166JJJ1_9AGAM|nr:multicopper oxidase [Fibularhizoctonia sp. CBS 109695]
MPHTEFYNLYALLAGLRGVRAAIGPVADLVIANAIIGPDGFNRSTVLAGGTFPGPLITANKGDYFQINVQDELTDPTMLLSTSIHWHGIFQNRTAGMDGAAFVTQCPIVANDSFIYNFTGYDQAGTYWYHSHLSTQYCDGLRGPLVIYDPEDPYLHMYDVDDDTTVIVLSDWYHTVAPQAGIIPRPNATLINGAGRYTGGPAMPLTSIAVESGKRYRFRLISTSCDPDYIFSIDGHNMTIIEADGLETEPLVVDQLQIFAGQRYSFILEANQTVDNYRIRANPNLGTTGFDGGLNSAILRYSGANATADPTTNQTTSVIPLIEADLVPLVNPGAPGTAEVGGADVLLNLDIAFNGANLNFTINGVSFVSPTIPVLLQILSGAQQATDLLPSGSVYVLPPNKVIELSMPAGAAGGPHPFHLHGHAFDVVRSAGQTGYNYINPPRRDVVSIGAAGDNVTIRWTTDNAGPWHLHCHIDWHLDLGLAIVFAENPAGVVAHDVNTTAWDGLCPIYDALSLEQLGGIVPS